MKKVISSIVALGVLLLLLFVGYLSGADASGENGNQEGSNKGVSTQEGNKQAESLEIEDNVVPDWLYESIQSKFELADDTKVHREDITFAKVSMKDSPETQIAAFATISRLHGVFVLYEDVDGHYEEVYSLAEPVYGLQVFGAGRQFVAFTSGFGGSGMQENYFHVLGYVGEGEEADAGSDVEAGYQEVWTGLAEQLQFAGPLPYFQVNGALNFDLVNGELFYSQTKRIYKDYDYDVAPPDEIHSKTEILKFNEQSQKFEPVYTELKEK